MNHQISPTEVTLLSYQQKHRTFFENVSNLESFLWKKSLETIQIDRPIFVLGLARSGTTILTQLIHTHPAVGSLTYRNFPFIYAPLLWKKIAPRYYGDQKSMPRAHLDGLQIDLTSADSFEEIFWQTWFPGTTENKINLDENLQIRQQHEQLIRKVLFQSNADRFLSKGNLNVLRIDYLRETFPDAKFVVCVRHPLDQVDSLVRQHQLFCRLAKNDPLIEKYLSLLGHFEFGPHRRPVTFEGSRRTQETVRYWTENRDSDGYLLQWLDIYEKLFNSLQSDASWVFHESLVSQPIEQLKRQFKFLELEELISYDTLAQQIHKPQSLQLDLNFNSEILDECNELYARIYRSVNGA